MRISLKSTKRQIRGANAEPTKKLIDIKRAKKGDKWEHGAREEHEFFQNKTK